MNIKDLIAHIETLPRGQSIFATKMLEELGGHPMSMHVLLGKLAAGGFLTKHDDGKYLATGNPYVARPQKKRAAKPVEIDEPEAEPEPTPVQMWLRHDGTLQITDSTNDSITLEPTDTIKLRNFLTAMGPSAAAETQEDKIPYSGVYPTSWQGLVK